MVNDHTAAEENTQYVSVMLKIAQQAASFVGTELLNERMFDSRSKMSR